MVSVKRIPGGLKVLAGVAAAAAAAVLWLSVSAGAPPKPPEAKETALAKRGELTLAIDTQGQFEAEKSVAVNPEVSGSATLTYIVPEGSAVQAGEVIARFDTEDIESQISELTVAAERSRNEYTQDEESRKILEGQLGADTAAALFSLQSAEFEQAQYGTVVLTAEGEPDEAAYAAGALRGEAYQAFRDALLDIRRAETALERASSDFQGMDTLLAKGFVPQSEYLTAQLAVIEAQRDLESKTLAYEILRDYTYPQTRARKEQAVREAVSKLEETEVQSGLKLNQARTGISAAKLAYENNRQRLEALKKELLNRTVTAPVAGVVLYGSPDQPWFHDHIAVGQRIWRGMRLFTIPDLSSIIVRARILEMDVYSVAVGRKALISVDAVPGLQLEGELAKVSELARDDAPWHSATRGGRTFEVTVRLDTTDDRIKPGMSCDLTIISDVIKDALYVPVSSVFREEDRQFSYVIDGAGDRRVEVTTGRASDEYVEILSGLEAGQRVLVAEIAPKAADGGKRGG